MKKMFNMCNIIYISAIHTILCFDTKFYAKNHVFSLKNLFQKKFFCVEEAIKFSILPKRKFRVSTVITC